MQDTTIFLGHDGRLEAVDEAFSARAVVDPTHFIVNAWRDPDDDDALHVSVHAPEPVLLSVGDDDVTLTPGNPYLVGEVTTHNTDDTPTVICVPGEPIHVFGHVRIITRSHEAADYLAAEAEDAREAEVARLEVEDAAPDLDDPLGPTGPVLEAIRDALPIGPRRAAVAHAIINARRWATP